MALADYTARYNFTVSDAFLRRVQVAITVEAILALQDKANANYTKRAALGQSIMANPTQYAPAFAFAIMTNMGFNDASTDAGLQVEAHNHYDQLAGV